MADYKVSDLKAGMVVWESCQYGNVRLTVKEDAYRSGFNKGWAADCVDDFGHAVHLYCADEGGGRLSLYDQPAYSGVRTICAPENLPDGAAREHLQAMAPMAHACNETARNTVDLTKMMEGILPDCNEEQRVILENVIADLRQKAGEMVVV